MIEITKDFKTFADMIKYLKSDYVYMMYDKVYSLVGNTVIKSSHNILHQYINGILQIKTSDIIAISDVHKSTSAPIYLYSNNIQCGDTLITFIPLNDNPTNKLNSIISNSPIYHNVSLRENDTFNDIIALKSVDGASLFIVDNKYPMTIFGSILNVNKADTVELKIYYIDNHSFLSQFSVNKKKFTIDTYMRFIYL